MEMVIITCRVGAKRLNPFGPNDGVYISLAPWLLPYLWSDNDRRRLRLPGICLRSVLSAGTAELAIYVPSRTIGLMAASAGVDEGFRFAIGDARGMPPAGAGKYDNILQLQQIWNAINVIITSWCCNATVAAAGH